MYLNIVYAGLAISVSFILTVIFTPVILRIAHRFSWYDEVNHRKIHDGDIPRLGGVSIFLSSLFMWISFNLARVAISDQFVLIDMARYLPVLIGASFVFTIGLLDDFTDIRARYKLFGQIAATLIVTLGGFTFRSVTIPFTGVTMELGLPGSHVFTVFWIVGVTNAYNLIDGIDGLSGGIGVIASLALAVAAWTAGSFTAGFMAFFLCGALLGFLVFNFPPAKIFMGDSGSLFVGFCLSIIPVIAFRGPLAPKGFGIGATLLLVPLLDMVAAIIRRIRRRLPVYRPDMEHLHHKLLSFGLSHLRILALVYSISGLTAGSVFFWASRDMHNPLDPAVVVGFCAAWGGVGIFFVVIDQLHRKKLGRRYFHRGDDPDAYKILNE